MAAQWLTAQDANWNLERGAFNTLVDQQPVGIAVPRNADEVSDVVRSAAAEGKRVAAQHTGHNAVPLGSLASTVLLRAAGLGGVQIDADAASARVGAGALWGDLVPGASDQGLAALHGSAPGVGIAGYTLGGGASFYARKHGLACNRVTAIELVTAGGEQIRVDAENEPDLFWAEAEAASVSSLRWSSTYCRCPRSSRAPYCSLLNRRARFCTAGGSGPAECQRR
jgi:FAD/FMN-containing dehydrogenase